MHAKTRAIPRAKRFRLPADGRTASDITFSVAPGSGPLAFLRLTRGSFSPDSIVREASFPVVGTEVTARIYSPRRPCAGHLLGPGVRLRVEFVSVSFLQGLLYEWLPTLAYALVFALILRSYAVASFFIPSGSMEDTLQKGDLLIADKFSYKILRHEPQRGDIVIFWPPTKTSDPYIKRVIGLPGDTLSVHEGTVFIDGHGLNESYIKEHPYSDFGPVTIPNDSFFMMGDNRNHSSDSRVWGFVARKKIEGRALFVFWPPTHVKII